MAVVSVDANRPYYEPLTLMLSKETVSRMEETFTLTEAEELELLESIAQIDRGDYVTFDQLLALLSQTPPTD